MLDDLESNIFQEDKVESTTNKFSLTRFNLPDSFQNNKILAMSSSKKYIYLVGANSELFRIESDTLKPINQSYTIPKLEEMPKFYENFPKIWTDREGNHSIIRLNRGIFYFNSNGSTVKELKSFKGLEICAVGFDDRNTDYKTTGNFLATDYLNNIYECNITIDNFEMNGDYSLRDTAERLTTLSFKDSENDDEDDINEPRSKNYDRIYGIRFFRATRNNINTNENACYIIIITKNRFYQFTGPGLTSFKQIFGRFERTPTLFNDCCKFFPQTVRRKGPFNGTDLDILFRNEQRSVGDKKSIKLDVFNQFGWKTESGFCYGYFTYDNNTKSTGLPREQKNFIVVPFTKITSQGQKETGEPNCIVHTNNHIFLLFKDCLSVISKLTSNIIHTQYFTTNYEQMLYVEFAKDNGIILLNSSYGLFQISLKDENSDIWKDYLEIGEYSKAQNFCGSDELKRKINRIDAEYEFEEKKDGFNAANKFANSDEKFEIVCLKYLMRNDIDGLNLFLQVYKETNLHKQGNKENQGKKEDLLQLNLLCTWLVEIFINQSPPNKPNLDDFRILVRENRHYLDSGLIYQLLQNYGRMAEYIEYASLMNDYDKVISYYINQGKIDEALDNLTYFASFDDKETIKILTKIFLDHCHIFFKKNPKESISLIQQRFKDVKMEFIVQAIMSTTGKDISSNNYFDNEKPEEKAKKAENTQAILSYLKSLVEKPKVEEQNNIHNLYIYYLSRNKANQEAILDYLKKPLINEENEIYKKKKEVLFQLDYAKKLFKDNPPAYSLVLALMGKYFEGVKVALNEKNDVCKGIAKFIASNAPGEKLRKKLWIEIFGCDTQNEFKQALDIMKESKILKIEDVLPHITDTIKIEEFKNQISTCIKEYETNIKQLKENINSYNITAENIKRDIDRVKKKSIEVDYINCKCEICQGYIKDKIIFLFPCGHMFDMNCIKDTLLSYEATGLDYVHDRNVEIDDLFFQLGYSKERSFKKDSKGGKDENEIKKSEDIVERAPSGFFSKFGFKKQEVQETKNPKQIQILREKLYNILNEQCILCGDFMVDSIQCSLSQKERFEYDKNNLKLNIQKEPEFTF